MALTRLALLFCMLVAFVPAQAVAQPPLVREPDRPVRGIFRGNERDLQSPQSLSINLALFETYDGNIIASDSMLVPATVPKRSGTYTRANAGVFYAKRRRVVQFAADGTVGFDYYPHLTAEIAQPLQAYNGTAGLSLQLGRNTLRASESLRRQPYFGFDLMQSTTNPDAPLVANNSPSFTPQVALLNEPIVIYGTSVSFTAPFGRRTTLDTNYDYGGSTTSDRWPTLNSQALAVRLSRTIVRTLDVNGGYTYRFATFRTPFAPSGDIHEHNAEGGIRYTRPFSRTRTVTMSVGAGRSIMDEHVLPSLGVGRVSGFTSRGVMSIQFARSWSASGEFRRSLQLLQGFERPYYGNVFSVGIRGEPSRRLDIAVETFLLRSAPASQALAAAYDTFTSSARLRYALTRNLAISTEYLHSEYEFGRTAQLPPGVLGSLGRDVVQVGLTFGKALMGRQVTP